MMKTPPELLELIEPAPRKEVARSAARPAIIIGGGAGHVGSTTLATILLAMGAASCGMAFDRREYGARSRLSQMWSGGVEDYAVSVRLSRHNAQDSALWLPFDLMAREMARGDVVIDLGSDLLFLLWKWMDISDVDVVFRSPGATHDKPDVAPRPVLLIVMVATAQSIADAREAIERFARTTMRFSRVIVVANQNLGPVLEVGGPDLEFIQGAVERGEVGLIVMPRCHGAALLAVDQNRAALADLPGMGVGRFQEVSGLDAARSAFALMHVSSFALTVVSSAAEAGLSCGLSPAGWTLETLRAATEKASEDFRREANVRRRDLLEKLRTLIDGRSGLALKAIFAKLKPSDQRLALDLFPDLVMLVHGEFVKARKEERHPDMNCVARALEGVRLTQERRRMFAPAARSTKFGADGAIYVDPPRARVEQAIRLARGGGGADGQARDVELTRIRSKWGRIASIPVAICHLLMEDEA